MLNSPAVISSACFECFLCINPSELCILFLPYWPFVNWAFSLTPTNHSSNIHLGFVTVWLPSMGKSASGKPHWTTLTALLSFAQVTTGAFSMLDTGFTVDNSSLNNSVNRVMSVPCSTLTISLSATAAVIFSICVHLSLHRTGKARKYNTVFPCAHLIVPSSNLCSGMYKSLVCGGWTPCRYPTKYALQIYPPHFPVLSVLGTNL